ncbi:MAG: hypothetical protein JWL63_1506 [Rhodocyclales bacterium]|nr:hypothetical protein [Rhodocyclales bacterium]
MSDRLAAALAAVVVLALIASGLTPFDRTTWWLEVAPVIIALPVLFATRRSFPLTPLLYWIIAIHALVLIAGGAWSYARVPLGFWLQHVLALSRNPYDKIGHFMQGLTPALLCCEILLRGGYMRISKARRMTAFLAICVAMAISACYELIEWGAAVALGQGADEFLGTQGDPWDTQSDMFMALLGAGFAMFCLRRWHSRQMQKVGPGRS